MRPADDVFPSFTDSPLILDSEMGETLQESEFEFFNTALPQDPPASSPAAILDDDILSTPRPQEHLGDRLAGDVSAPVLTHGHKAAHIAPNTLGLSTGPLQSLPEGASASPPSSGQDSSSDSSHDRGHKRKSSSTSSQSMAAPGDVMMTEDMDMTGWKHDELMTGGDGPTFNGFGNGIPFLAGSPDPLAMDTDFETSNKAMEEAFDFESAASSPGHVSAGTPASNVTAQPSNTTKLPSREPPRASQRRDRRSQISTHSNAQSSNNGFATQESREVSPRSNMIFSKESSPSFFTNITPSPTFGVDVGSGPMLTGSSANPTWPTGSAFTTGGPPSQTSSSVTPSPPAPDHSVTPSSTSTGAEGTSSNPLTIHPTPLKSRVETQIPIKLTLKTLPPGVLKLHLPTHTISKPKLLTKLPPAKAADTLELETMLVSTTAMRDPEKLKRALLRAAHGNSDEADEQSPQVDRPTLDVKKEPRRASSGDVSAAADEEDDGDESKPLNGGEVKICLGCITRERKRAARKKVKKVEEEESWHQDEHRRVVVFNTHEIKEWVEPSNATNMPDGVVSEGAPPVVPEGAMQVDLPMRIACYCRHHNEKLGFRVIFTIKDHEDQLVAQAITSSIMITDDHKTHAAASLALNAQPVITNAVPISGAVPHGAFPSGPMFGFPGASPMVGPFRQSHSSSDLQNLQNLQQQAYSSPYPPAPNNFSPNLSRTTSVSQTPRNQSRQASPTAAVGHSHKKRKSSGPTKVPSGLAMTRLETAQGQAAPNPTAAGPPAMHDPSLALSSTTPTFPPNAAAVGPQSFIQPQSSFHTGPSTPNQAGDQSQGLFTAANRSHSMENLPLGQMFSAPTSTHQSRAPSPTSAARNSINSFQQAQLTQGVTNGIYGLPTQLNPARPPRIHKIIPHEGPMSGGIEVTCLGSGFVQGLEVMFGGTQATTTTFWGETSLVCLLPPANEAGLVPVVFKHEHSSFGRPYGSPPALSRAPTLFKYRNDDEVEVIRLALAVLGEKVGSSADGALEVAALLLQGERARGGGNNWGASSGTGRTISGDGQHRRATGLETGLGAVDLENTLLKILDIIDQDESAYQARLNLRRPSGHTMLHCACSLGLHRFVAALLVRGANPDPRDKGGFTPMHFATLHDHPHIVRRLILSGADPTMRSLRGFTPADLATSDHALQATRRIEHHSRTRSGPFGHAFGRRVSSAASLSSLWDAPLPMRSRSLVAGQPSAGSNFYDYDDSDDDPILGMDDPVEMGRPGQFWSRSRSRRSSRASMPVAETVVPHPPMALPVTGDDGAAGAAAASMTAWRSQLTAQLQHLQQTVQWNLPNLPQIPTLPPLPNLPAYQTYLPNPMARRISSLVPRSPPPTPSNAPDDGARGAGGGKEGDYRWWELFSGSAPPPPAYDDIYPQSELAREMDTRDMKKDLAVQTALDTMADQRATEMFDQPAPSEGSSSDAMTMSQVPRTASIGSLKVRLGRTPLSREEQEALRAAHALKAKKIKSDRNLFFIWIPLLVIIVIAMLKNRLPEVWDSAWQMYSYVQHRNEGRIQEVV